jgi:hypothetical protein
MESEIEECVFLFHDTVLCRAYVNAVISTRFPNKAGKVGLVELFCFLLRKKLWLINYLN